MAKSFRTVQARLTRSRIRNGFRWAAALVPLASLPIVACSTSLGNSENEGVVASRGQALDAARPRQIYETRGHHPSVASAPSGAHLSYNTGRIVSNIQVVEVVYGGSPADYISQVTSTTSPNIPSYYQGILNSPYVDWLTEYNTTAPVPTPRTNQIVGRGTFSTRVTITPSAANNGSTIDDSNLQAELSAQIAAGTLPAPTHDAAGNNNTYYAVFFPHGKVITLQGSASCVQFCAYHGTIANAGGKGEIYYGVHPDLQTGSGCEGVCGLAPTTFGNVTQVASHELIETVTDPEVGLASVVGPPLAWYDPNFGEIGDICNDMHGTIVGGDGVTYDVQTEYSNAANDCIVARSGTGGSGGSGGSGGASAGSGGASAGSGGASAGSGGASAGSGGASAGSGGASAGSGGASAGSGGASAGSGGASAGSGGASAGSGGVAGGGGGTGGGGPCAGLCANPKSFTINGSFQSGSIGTGAVCLATTNPVHGGNCGNFVNPRSLSVNGQARPCNAGNWATIPAPRNGGYCIQATAGNQPWAFITAW